MITHVDIAVVVIGGWNIHLGSPDLLSGILSAVLFLQSCKNIRIDMCRHS